MVYINIASMIIYLAFYVLLYKQKYAVFAIGCGVEICTHVLFATIYCGLESGFNWCLIGLCVICFFAGYFSKDTRSLKRPTRWCLFMGLEYLFLVIFCEFHKPIYFLDSSVTFFFRIYHTIVVFSFVIVYLFVFAKYALNLEKSIKNESRIDRLTMVSNRHSLYNFFDCLENKELYALAIFDIDDFKKINDTYGHICGDFILKEIARLTREYFSSDYVCRYGGEEFVVIFKMDNDYEKTYLRVDNFRELISKHKFTFDEKDIPCTITVGLNKYESNYNIDKWVMNADNKLYEGKNSGKNKTVS